MTDLWWYNMVGDATKIHWQHGETLPDGADCTSYDFLNQFVYQGNRRRTMYRMAGGVAGAYDGTVSPYSSAPAAASGFRLFSQSNLYLHRQKACGNTGSGGIMYAKTSALPANGSAKPEVAAILNEFDLAYPTSNTAPGEFVPVAFYTALKEFIDGVRVFGVAPTYYSPEGVATGGTRVRYKWDLAWDGSYFWESVDPTGAGPTNLGAFGNSWEDEDDGFGGIDGFRSSDALENPQITFQNRGVEVTAKLGMYAVGVRQEGSMADGFAYPGTDVLSKIAETTRTVAAGDDFNMVYSGVLGHATLFNDYVPSSNQAGNWTCRLAKYAELVDVNLTL